MSARQRRWLKGELPRLVEAGVLDAAAAERLRAHYAQQAGDRGAVPLFAVLGAVFIGLGVVLLLAVNWEELSRGERAALIFSGLVGSQALAAFGLLRRAGSTAWSEATAIGLSLTAAAAIALIGQTYQVPGNLRGFLGTCIWLALPLVYVFDSRGSAMLVLFGIVGWLAASFASQGEPTLLLWGFWLVLAPYLVMRLRANAAPIRDSFLAWMAIPALLGCVLLVAPLENATSYAMLWALLVAGLAGAAISGAEAETPPAYTGAAATFGGIATAGTAVALGFAGLWDFVGETIERDASPLHAVAALVIAAGGALLAVRGGWTALHRGDFARALPVALPLVVGAGCFLTANTGENLPAAILMTLYGLGLGVLATLAGVRDADLRLANGGLFLLASLIYIRFSDWELSFTTRGLLFIGMGVCFLLMNLRLRGARTQASQ